ncbi:hypothetical protein [Paenibacillus sp. CR_12]|uniref:hypothetical protein n=1 Tax=Paenibacillus sp. CR_12 TaxID=3055793 RepID=UPI0035BFBA0B
MPLIYPTVSYGLHDSPVAALAYLIERYKEFDGWPKNDIPREPIHKDLLFTNATLYWLTRLQPPRRTYYDGAAGMPTDQTKVPTGVSLGGCSIFRRMAEANNHIVHWSNLESGSHMVAMSDPDSLVKDIREFLASFAANHNGIQASSINHPI